MEKSKNSHHKQKFVEREWTENTKGDYDEDGFFITPNGSKNIFLMIFLGFWDPDGIYFNREGYDRHGGYYDDNNGKYVPGRGWDDMHNCYFDEEYDDYEDFDDDDDLDCDINEDDLMDEEIPITNDIEKININNEDQFADDDECDKYENKEDDKLPPQKEEIKKEEPQKEPVKRCGLANMFP